MTKRYLNNRGFTILELLVVLGLIGILTLVAATNLKPLENPVYSSTHNLAAFFKQARARAVSTTSAYEVRPTSTNRIAAFYGQNCSSIEEIESQMVLDIPSRVSLLNTDWSVCFTARGLSSNNIEVEITDGEITRSVEILLGGMARIK